MTGRLPERLVSRIEQDERLDRGVPLVDRANDLIDEPVRSALRGDWLGHALHPMATDIPIGCFVSVGALDLIGGRRSGRAAQRLVGLGLLSAVPAVASGVVEAGLLREQRDRRVAVAHASGNALALLVYHRSWRARRRGHHLRGIALGTAGASLLAVTGYLGGHLAFARGAGNAQRDLSSVGDERQGVDRGEALLDANEARALLGVPQEQFDAMVEQGLLPAAGDSSYREADVLAVRMAGA
jgi:uncharacterized membrane protein